MAETELTYQQKINLMNHIGDAYRGSLRRIDLAESAVSSYPAERIQDDYAMKTLMERCLRDCSRDTQLITRRDFLEISEKHWYLLYFSQSKYYRLRKKAVDEFLHCLDVC